MPLSDAVPLPKTPPLMTPVTCHTHSYLSPPLAIVTTATMVLLSKQSLFPTQDLFIR